MDNLNQYDRLIDMMNKLDLQDDGIVQNNKIKGICIDFCQIVKNEEMLCESMDYINDKALDDNDSSLKFAVLFSSHFFDSLAMNSVKVRSKMISILEGNYRDAKDLKLTDKNRLYNSITLLGECFQRIRISNNHPINILGKSLLDLLNQTIRNRDYMDPKLARIILAQITLNGSNMNTYHKEELDELLFNIRLNLIEQNNLTDISKAILLMTLDLHYKNFSNLSKSLLEMYTKYLMKADDQLEANSSLSSPPSVTKKWSEQVVDELYNDNISTTDENNPTSPTNPSPPRQQQWRQPHYDRSRRQSGNFDEDRQSVRSEGGTLRLYNVGDRLRNQQRNHNNNNNGSNNWDAQQRYQQNRRSFTETNNDDENGNKGGGNRKHFNNYRPNNYEKPPRFRQKDNENGWRRQSSQSRDNYHEHDNNSSRSSSRNRTLPRNMKPKNGNYNGRRSVSPSTVSERNYRPQNSRNFSSQRNANNSSRYGSQNSIASDYGTWDRRRSGRRSGHNRNNDNNYSNRSSKNNSWESRGGDSNTSSNTNEEIVKHARETTKYMESLAQTSG